MGDSYDIIYYILVPITAAMIPVVYALLNKAKVTAATTAVSQYILEEIKNDLKDLKDRVRTLELLSPGSILSDHKK